MAIQFSNLASTSLASGVSSSATSVSVTSASLFPALGGGDYFYATLGAGTGSEIVKVTAISGTTFTVIRGQDDTTAVSHSAGADCALRVTAAALKDLRDATDNDTTYTGGTGITLSGTTFNLTDTAAKLNLTGGALTGTLLVGKTSSAFGTDGIELQASDNIWITKSGGNPLGLNRKSSDGSIIELYKDSSTLVGSISTYGGLIQIGQGNANLKFSNAADAITPANGSGSNNDNAVDLGTTAARFKDIYISGLNVTYSTYNKISSYFSGSYTSGFKFSDMNGGIWYDAGADDLTVSAGHANSKLILVSGGSTALTLLSDQTATFAAAVNIGGNINNYVAVNSGNPEFSMGSSATNRLLLQSVYGSGGQILNYVTLRTYTTANHANAGKITLGVDEVDILEVNDGGIGVTGNLSVSGTVDGRDVATDGTKLDTIATSANNYVLPSGIATETYVGNQITTLIGGAPSTLNDLNELAAAINDDANYNSTLTTALATKAPLASPTFTSNINVTGSSTLGSTAAPLRTLDSRGSGMAIFGTGSYTEIMLRERSGTLRNTGAWHWSVRGDVGGANDDLKLLRFTGGSYQGVAMQVASSTGNATFEGNITANGAINNVQSTTGTGSNAVKNIVYNYGGGDAALQLSIVGSIDYLLGVDNTDDTFKIGQASWDSSPYLAIDTSGRLLLGLSSATGYSADQDNFIIKGSAEVGMHIIGGTSSTTAINFGDGTGTSAYRGQITYHNADDSFRFNTAGSERLRIDSNGHLRFMSQGAGTQNNSSINNHTNNYVYFMGGSAGAMYQADNSGAVRLRLNSTTLALETASTPRISIGDDGVTTLSGATTVSSGYLTVQKAGLGGGQIGLGDWSNSNPIGISEGLWNTVSSDNDLITVYARSSFNIRGYAGGTTHWLSLTNGALNLVQSQALQIGGTTVIDASRNITAVTYTSSYAGNSSTANINITNTGSSAFNHSLNAFAPNMTAGESNILVVGSAGSTKNSGYIGYVYSSSGSNDNYVSLGLWAADHLLRLHGDGKLNLQTGYFQIGGTTVITNDRNLTNIGTATLSSATNMLLTLNPTAGNYGGILFQYGGATKGSSIYNSGMMVYGGESSTSLALQSGGAYGLFIHHSTRNVGIGNGTSAPAYKLHVTGTLGATGNATFGGTITSGNITAPKLYINSGTTYGVGIVNPASARFDTVDSGADADPLELVYYSGAGVRIGQGGGTKYLSAGSIQITGTQIVSAGRSIQNIVNYQGTGEIQINGNLQATHVYNSGSYYVLNQAGNGWNTVVDRGNGNNFTVNALDGFKIDGTTVIDASRNVLVGNNIHFNSATNSSFIGPSATANIRYAADGIHQFDTYNGGWITRAQITDSGLRLENDVGLSSTTSSGATRIVMPGGGAHQQVGGTATGAIKITLPVGMTNGMLTIKGIVYEYNTNKSFEFCVGGYNYPSGNTWAHNAFGYIVSSPLNTKTYAIRFGYDSGGKACVYIGETNTSWSYPQVSVTECTVGYSGTSAESWDSGWDVTFATTVENVTKTIAAADTRASVQRNASSYSPQYYDNDNTSYFLNPSAQGSVSLYTIGDWRQASGTWSGEVSGKMQYHSNNWYIQYGTEVLFRNSSAVNTMIMTSAGDMSVTSSSRAPYFYDSANTVFYLDPAGTSNTASRMRGGMLFGPNTTWGAYLYVGGDGRDGSYASVAATDGNLHLDAKTGKQLYLSYYNTNRTIVGGDMAAVAYYDRDDTGFYANPAGLSNFHRMALNPPTSGTLPVLQVNQGSSSHQGIAVDINQANAGNAIDVRGSVGAGHFTVSSAYNAGPIVLTTGSHRAPVFYDSDDTSFYTDAGNSSTSLRINGDILCDQQYGRGMVGVYSSTRLQHVWSMGAAYRIAADGGGAGNMYGMAWSHPNAANLGGGANHLNDHGLLIINNGGFRAAISSRAVFAEDIRAQLFYDFNDTNYYVDPHATSNFNQINWGHANRIITGGVVNGAHAVRIGGNWGEFECMGRVIDVSGSNCHFMDGYGSTDHASHYLSIGTGGGGNGGLGYVTIGTDLNVTGNVTAYYSDARLKQNVETIPNALEILDNIRGVTFEWNKLAEGVWKKKQGDEDFGMIAQEVEAVFPMGVAIQGGADFNKAAGFADPDSPNYDPLHDPTKDDPEYKTVKYDKMVALAIQAIKELKAEVDELKERLNSK